MRASSHLVIGNIPVNKHVEPTAQHDEFFFTALRPANR